MYVVPLTLIYLMGASLYAPYNSEASAFILKEMFQIPVFSGSSLRTRGGVGMTCRSTEMKTLA